MKNKILSYAAMALFVIGCNSSPYNNENHFIPNKGQNIDSLKEMVKEDTLNKAVFSVKIIADSMGREGVYNVNSVFGENVASSMFTMPKGGEKYKPILKKKSEMYTYIVGFHVPNDTTFYEYYEISANKGSILMRYVKSYTFQ